MTGYSIVYGCDTFLGGAIKLNWVWVLTRQAYVINSAAWTAMRETVFEVFRNKLSQPAYDPYTFLLNTIQNES